MKQIVGAYSGYGDRGPIPATGLSTQPGAFAPVMTDIMGSPREFAAKQKKFNEQGRQWSNQKMNISTPLESSYLEGLSFAYATAIQRLIDECRRYGGDGVLDITPQITIAALDPGDSAPTGEWKLFQGRQQLIGYWSIYNVALTGTVVRMDTFRTAKPFTTTLPGTDVASLLAHGWIPRTSLISVGFAQGWIQKKEYRKLRWARKNLESTFHTRLSAQSKNLCRIQLEQDMKKDGSTTNLIANQSFALSAPKNSTLDEYGLNFTNGRTVQTKSQSAQTVLLSNTIAPLKFTLGHKTSPETTIILKN